MINNIIYWFILSLITTIHDLKLNLLELSFVCCYGIDKFYKKDQISMVLMLVLGLIKYTVNFKIDCFFCFILMNYYFLVNFVFKGQMAISFITDRLHLSLNNICYALSFLSLNWDVLRHIDKLLLVQLKRKGE